MKVRLLDVAQVELGDAWRWYEAQVPGLGSRFLREVRDARNMILSHPEAWHSLGDGVRRCRLKRFPYGLIYAVLDDEVLILAVAHHHREPDYWRTRLTRMPTRN